MRLGTLLVLVAFGVALVLTPEPCVASEQGFRFTLEGSVGVAHVPMTEWRDFFEDFGDYRDQDYAGFYEVGFRCHLSARSSLVLSYERLTTDAWQPLEIFYGTPEDTTGYGFGVTEWEFEATPVSLSYEFHPWGSLEDVSPYLGVGASYYFFTGVDGQMTKYEDEYFPRWVQRGSRGGRGYGVHAYVGCRVMLVEGLYMASRVRGRYADGTGLTDAEEDIAIHLSGFDVALGLGYEF